MYLDITSEAPRPGPPSVIIWVISNESVRKAPIIVTTSATNVEGHNCGQTIYLKSFHPDAPSILAASICSELTEVRPAK